LITGRLTSASPLDRPEKNSIQLKFKQEQQGSSWAEAGVDDDSQAQTDKKRQKTKKREESCVVSEAAMIRMEWALLLPVHGGRWEG
jgi:hypothetical protein